MLPTQIDSPKENFFFPILLLAVSAILSGCNSSNDGTKTDGTGTVAGNSAGRTDGNTVGNSLTVASWGGQYEFSQQKAYHEPWTTKTGRSRLEWVPM